MDQSSLKLWNGSIVNSTVTKRLSKMKQKGKKCVGGNKTKSQVVRPYLIISHNVTLMQIGSRTLTWGWGWGA